MLFKAPIITVIPGTPGRTASPAVHECADLDGGIGGISDGTDPAAPPPPSGTGYSPASGEFILLHTGAGYSESVAPAPAGYACRWEPNPVVAGGVTYLGVVVCEGP